MANAAAAVSYGVRRFIMGGRATHGFIVVAGDTLDETMLEGWITRARAHVAALPPEDTGGTAPIFAWTDMTFLLHHAGVSCGY